MKLRVGILDPLLGWELVLKQIGIPYRTINDEEFLKAEDFPVLIISSLKSRNNQKNILRYVQSGGCLLLEASMGRKLLNLKVKHQYIKYLAPDESPFMRSTSPCDVYKSCRIAADARYVKNQQGHPSIAIKTVGEGYVIVLPSGLVTALQDYKIKRKNFPSEFGKRQPSERVSRVSKGGIRCLVQDALAFLFRARNLPFPHLWYFPGGAKTQFSFRVDTDFSPKKQVESLYHLCRKYSIPATWFVDSKSQAAWINFYSTMQDQEIGYHCYRHRVFSDQKRIRNDYKQGLKIMHKAGMEPKGYAAPYGEWHPTLARVVQEYDFHYSSEFGLAYDDIPFFSYREGTFSSVLQIPIHPVSTGSLRRAHHSREDMLSYYNQLVGLKQTVDQPIIFYHHPVHGYFEVFEQIFKKIRHENIPVVSLGDYADWWIKRNKVTWDPEINQKELTFNASGADSSIWVRMLLPDGKAILHPITQPCDLKKPKYWLKKREDTISYDSDQLRQLNWRMLLHDIQHFRGKLKQ